MNDINIWAASSNRKFAYLNMAIVTIKADTTYLAHNIAAKKLLLCLLANFFIILSPFKLSICYYRRLC